MSSLLEHATQAGLSSIQLERLQSNYRVWPFIGFSIWWKDNAPKKRANALGIQADTRAYSTYELACKVFDLRHCEDFQYQLGLSFSVGHNDITARHGMFNEMTGLADKKERVVYFVPPKLMTHPRARLAKFEMQYLLKPIKPIEADIVFGAYSFISHVLLLAGAKMSP